MRVVFDDRERSQTVTVINSSSTASTYRIEMVNFKQLPDGKYEELKEEQGLSVDVFQADNMIRFSPRQVTLKPGDKQQVRLSLRKPANLANGEYRSHLKFVQLPNPEMLQANQKGAGIKLYMLTSFTIPVQVRQGQVIVDTQIQQAKIKRSQDGFWSVETQINRQGDFSSFGKLAVYWRDNSNGEYEELNFLNNVALYRETSSRIMNLVLQNEQVKAGQYKVGFYPTSHFKQERFDEFEFNYSGK